MRTISRTAKFKKDYKREAKGQHRATLDADIVPVLTALASDELLETRRRDHGQGKRHWIGLSTLFYLDHK